ncbi:MAG: PIN domain nuclease [Anaerolineae bacterium]
MTTLVDSSVWIDYFNGVSTPQTDYLEGKEFIVVGDPILVEVLQGFRQEKDFAAARDSLLKFPVLTIGGQEMALKSASHYRLLRSSGITIRKTIDCLIATFCIESNFSLLHTDRDFEPFVTHLGLKTINFAI